MGTVGKMKHWIFGSLQKSRYDTTLQANANPILYFCFQSNHDDSGFYTVPRVNDVLLALLICQNGNKVGFIGLGNIGRAGHGQESH